MAAGVDYTEEQLNYYRICYVTTDILTEGLRVIFKQEWDHRYKATWRDDPKNGLDFWNGESSRNRKKNARLLTTMIKGNRAEWDCTILFYAILFSDCIHGLNPIVRSNVNDLRLFRNEEFAHMPRGHLSDTEFQNTITKVQTAFQALGLSTLKIQDIKSQTSFNTDQVDDLHQELQEKEKALQEKEEQRHILEEQLHGDISRFCILPPKPSHDVAPRDCDVAEITQQLKALKDSSENGLSYLYISGNPGSGKSQLASLVAKRFFDDVKEIPSITSFVMTLNVENSETLLESYVSFARHLKCPEYAVTNTINATDWNTDEKIINLKTLISTKIKLYTTFLLVVDNVTSISHVHVHFPDPGNGQWARGQLLITTQDTASIPLTSSFIHHISVSKGMDPREASSLLATLSGFMDPEMEMEVAKVLDYQPLALASAATYVREVRQNKLTSNFGWRDFLTKLNQGQRSTTEAILAEINPSYQTSMTAAITLAVKKAMKSDKVIDHTFSLLSLCAPQPVSLDIVINYILNVDQEFEDKEVVALRIHRCSLLLFEQEEGDVYIRVHRIVHDVISTVIKQYADDKQLKAINAAVTSFSQFIIDQTLSLDREDLDTLVKSKNIVPHLTTLIAKIEHLFSKENISQVTQSSLFTPKQHPRNFQTLGETCRKHCEFQAELKYFNLALKFVHSTDAACSEVDEPNAYCYVGTAHYDLGEFHQAKNTFASELAIRLKKQGPNHIDVATTYNNLGTVHHDLGDLQQAKECHDRALTIRLKELGPEHVDVATTYNNLGAVHLDLGDLEQAKKCHDRALTIRLKTFGHEHVNVANTYNNLGAVHLDLGDLQQANECYDRALTIRLQKLGPEHVDVATTYNNLGAVLRALGDLEQAKQYHDLALTIRLKKLGPEHVSVANTCNNLGAVHRDLGDLEQAKDYYNRTLKIRLKKLGPEHVDVATTYNDLGTVHRDASDLGQAKECYDRALTIRLRKLGPRHILVATTYNDLSIVHRDLGDLQLAEQCDDRARTILWTNQRFEHVDGTTVRTNLVRLQREEETVDHLSAVPLRKRQHVRRSTCNCTIL